MSDQLFRLDNSAVPQTSDNGDGAAPHNRRFEG
jgi:hypothetical protein